MNIYLLFKKILLNKMFDFTKILHRNKKNAIKCDKIRKVTLLQNKKENIKDEKRKCKKQKRKNLKKD